jgi:cellulose synthase/poly-beta-1,6-N-acetylglucosamine synthase-like glycosyltransferase
MTTDRPILSVVVIGRNEGERLARCLESVVAMKFSDGSLEVIYVDSASTDRSVECARQFGVAVIQIHPARPCAAIGRNAGWRAARGALVLFLDGDTILDPEFFGEAKLQFRDSSVAVVFGSRREINVSGSIYNRVLDLDWIARPGAVEFCGGDALVRREVLEQVGGYDEGLIAAEDTELCSRIRALGYKVLCLDRRMVGHDLAINRLSQYWRRAIRTGYAYGEVSDRFDPNDSPIWYRQARRNRIQGFVMLAIVAISPILSVATRSMIPTGVAIAFVAALSVRTAVRTRWKHADFYTRLLHGLHSHLVQIPLFFGQLKYQRDRLLGRTAELIEYKDMGARNRSGGGSILR